MASGHCEADPSLVEHDPQPPPDDAGFALAPGAGVAEALATATGGGPPGTRTEARSALSRFAKPSWVAAAGLDEPV